MSAPTMRYVALANVIESTTNYRRRHDEAAHHELVASIREKGIITPLVVRPVNEHADESWLYEVAAGHRRLRAARAAGLAEVPVSVREMDDREFAEIMLTENIQRVDPDPLDEATAYQQLIDQLGYDPTTLALKFGKSETYVRSRLVLANLSERAREALGRGAIELGHAVLLARTTPEKQDELLQKTLLVSRALPPAQFRPDEVEELGDEDYEPARQEGSRKVATDPARTLVSIGELRQIMAEKLQPLGCVKWDRDDATLVPAAGACSSCPKRTGANPTLFEELDATDDRCPDVACYDSKRTAWLARRAASLREQMPNLVVISTKWSRPLRQFNGETVLRKDKEWKATKAKSGLTPALVVDADGADYNIQEHWEKIGEVLEVKRITPEKKAKAAPAAAPRTSGRAGKASPELVAQHERAKELFKCGLVEVLTALAGAERDVTDERNAVFDVMLQGRRNVNLPWEIRDVAAAAILNRDVTDEGDEDDGDPITEKELAGITDRQAKLVAAMIVRGVTVPYFNCWAPSRSDDPAIDERTGAYPVPDALVQLGVEAGVDVPAVWDGTIALANAVARTEQADAPAPKKGKRGKQA